MISDFRYGYYFLSNFYEGKIFYYNNMAFTNSEAAFHSQKDLKRQQEFERIGPSDSKRLGRRVKLRNDWEEVKDEIMYDILFQKFTQDEILKTQLLSTKDETLIEGNYWHDNYWGICFCDKCKDKDGKNKLGYLLMELRKNLKEAD